VSLQVVALVVPIVVAVVSGAFAYVQARKIADRNASLETRKIDLSEYESLNRALRDEIDKLRTDRVEDANRHREEIARISSEIRDLEERARSGAPPPGRSWSR
jgi:flagellar motility protein MotE (MotC chaperone)